MLGLFLCVLASCQPQTMYHSFHTLPEDGWNKSDTLIFTIPTQAIQADEYELQIEMRYTSKLPYRSLWIVVYQNSQDSTHFTSDTLQCVLVNESGNLKGNGMSNYYQQSFPIKRVKLNKSYTPIFKIAHYMKKGRIEGINDIGIRLYDEKRQSEGKQTIK